MASRASWARLDLATREFWRVVGRPVDLDRGDRWLDAPRGDGADIGASWLEAAAAALGGRVDRDALDAGLLTDLAVLDGPEFSAAEVHLQSGQTLAKIFVHAFGACHRSARPSGNLFQYDFIKIGRAHV